MITIISIGRKYDEHQAADIRIDATRWPAPPPDYRQLDGRHGAIQTSVLTPDPLVLDFLILVAGWASTLARLQEQVTVVIECAEGIHRSVAGAECLLALVRDTGADATVFHRDLGRRAA
ncbi:RapZ C-terminal domain-containing protein [Corynebacterium sp. AOP40-9SA-29]|uniref:RapZ C-terminal domain-containing protein n=1 Tax=Corynebacterium sp. AOP40-9SA-29 TaxID=3457677 RepID=UPI004033FD5C